MSLWTIKHWSILTDLSGVRHMPHGDGGFFTEEEALEQLINLATRRRAEMSEHIRKARRRLAACQHKRG